MSRHGRAGSGVLANAAWLTGERVIALSLQLVSSVVVARYLGPDEFGVFAYVMGVFGLLSAAATLGLEQLVIRDWASRPREEAQHRLVGAVLLSFGASLVLAIIMVAITWMSGVTGARLGGLILAASLVWMPTTLVSGAFAAELRSRVPAMLQAASSAAGALLRIGAAAVAAPLWAFFAVTSLASALYAGGIARAFRQENTWRVELPAVTILRDLWRDAWPLLISTVSIAVYMRIDILMLEAIRGPRDVAMYAIAVRIAELPYIVLTAIGVSMLPGVAQADEGELASKMQRLFDIEFNVAAVAAIGVTATAGIVVPLLYGGDYAEAVQPLRVMAWSGLFVAWGVALSRWLVVTDRLRYQALAAASGAVTNVAVNLLLIPRWGSTGAAFATLVSQAAATYLVSGLVRPLRPATGWMHRSVGGGGRAVRAMRELRGSLG